MKRNEKNEKKKAELIAAISENPGSNTGDIRKKVEEFLKPFEIPFYYSDFTSSVWELVTRGVVIWYSHSFKTSKEGKFQSKHQVVFMSGPRIAYGKKRWPKNLLGKIGVSTPKEQPWEKTEREKLEAKKAEEEEARLHPDFHKCGTLFCRLWVGHPGEHQDHVRGYADSDYNWFLDEDGRRPWWPEFKGAAHED